MHKHRGGTSKPGDREEERILNRVRFNSIANCHNRDECEARRALSYRRLRLGETLNAECRREARSRSAAT